MTPAETIELIGREANERLHPSLTNPSWLVLRKRRELFRNWLKELPGHDLRVLDVGGRIQPYRPMLSDRPHQYVAVDIRPTPVVDLVARAESLPLPSEYFDVVFCTQVLEYVRDPQSAVSEIFRVLKTSGFLFLSAPAIFPRDSDPEYWRFLPASLRLLLDAFRHVEIAPEGSSISGALRTMNLLFASAPNAALRHLFRFTLIPTLNVTGVMLESMLPTANDQFSANFSALAQK